MRDDGELVAFCRSAWPRLVIALSRQFGDQALGEELAQEALVRVCSRWERVRSMEQPLGWAFVVGVNAGRSRIRRRTLERRARRHVSHDLPLDHEQRTVDRVTLDRALQRLPSRQREVLILRYLLDLSVERTAEVMGLSSTAVRSLSQRAARQLATRMPAPSADEEVHR